MKGHILISNATMILPSGAMNGDLRIRDGIITEIETNSRLPRRNDEDYIDAEGLVLLPGIIDPQCHFRDPGQPEKEDLGSGSAAAVSGGVTSFLDMPNNVPSITTFEMMMEKIETAKSKCVNNFGFFVGATPDNVDNPDENPLSFAEREYTISGLNSFSTAAIKIEFKSTSTVEVPRVKNLRIIALAL